MAQNLPATGPPAEARAEARPESRSERKHRQILDAATSAFLEGGYRGTSMDEVAATAGVSKQTVYKHFSDKASLFGEIVRSTVEVAANPVHEEVTRLADTGDLEADLVDLARRQLDAVLQAQLLRLRRLVIAEAGRFPELGRMFYDQGAGRTMRTLAASLARLSERGLLAVDDAERAAAELNWLLMAGPVNRAMLLGDDALPTRAELDRHAAAAVATFLAAYGR